VCVRVEDEQFKYFVVLLEFLSSQIKSRNHLGTCCLTFPSEALFVMSMQPKFDALLFALGAFTKLRKATISFVIYVCLSVTMQ
jgi:hypothetical protein